MRSTFPNGRLDLSGKTKCEMGCAPSIPMGEHVQDEDREGVQTGGSKRLPPSPSVFCSFRSFVWLFFLSFFLSVQYSQVPCSTLNTEKIIPKTKNSSFYWWPFIHSVYNVINQNPKKTVYIEDGREAMLDEIVHKSFEINQKTICRLYQIYIKKKLNSEMS